jgi:ubiquinone/menaquinone biosynthesis C-methylase UbiE
LVPSTQYDRIAQEYEAYSEANPYNAYCERPTTLSLIPSVLGRDVLDAACGPGFYGAWALAQGAKVLAFDASMKMVALAQKRLGQSAVRVACLADRLTWCEDESFDVVICALALEYVDDILAAVREFHRLLRSGGHVVLSMEHPAIVKERPEVGLGQKIVEHRSAILGTRLSYSRPMEAYLDALEAAGFASIVVKEAWPTQECRVRYPEVYEKLRSRPQFVAVRAQKPSRDQ